MYPDYYICFLFSLCIETLQLITKVGVFDVDDLMMNTVGGLIGWINLLHYQIYLSQMEGKE